MSAQTTHGPDTHKAGIARAKAIREYDAAKAVWERANAEGDAGIAARRSAEGTLAVRSQRIRDAELELALEGVEYDPWVKPAVSGKAVTRTDKTPDELKAALADVRTLLTTHGHMPTVVRSAKQREAALLRQAKTRGYDLA